VASLSASNSLTDTPGPILAARKLGRTVIAYKNRGIYLGQPTQPPLIWDWYLAHPEIGTFGNGCVVDAGGFHAFVGINDFYTFDGAQVQSIRDANGVNPVKEWFFANMNGNYSANILGRLDRANDTVYWHFPSLQSAGLLDTWVAWNYRTNRWTKGIASIEAIAYPYVPISLPTTFDQFSNTYGTFDGIPDLPFDSQQFFGSTQLSQGYFQADHSLYSLNGAPSPSSFTTGDMGDDKRFSFFSMIRPNFATVPAAAGAMSLTDNHRETLGAPLVADEPELMDVDGNINMIGNDRYHRFSAALTGDYEILGMDIDFQDAGAR